MYSSSEGTIEIFPEYADGLQEIEGFSHHILFYHFHHTGALRLRVAPFLDNENVRGIFATRHHDRPNRIGLSIVELLSVEDTTLSIRGVDVLDGTPPSISSRMSFTLTTVTMSGQAGSTGLTWNGKNRTSRRNP